MEAGLSVEDALEVVNQGLDGLKTSPRALEFRYEPGIDSNGESAAFITVVVEDTTNGEPYPWTRLKPIHDLIWRVFTEKAVERKPYIDFRLKSEADESDDEELEVGQRE